jgi:hypothetical protein
MGRVGSLGTEFGKNVYTPLDLFRYTSSGVRDLTPASGYFSVDGKTMLMQYNNPNNGGDASDWNPSIKGDSFGSGYTGVAALVSATDLREMDVLGYTLATTNAGASSAAGGSGASSVGSGLTGSSMQGSAVQMIQAIAAMPHTTPSSAVPVLVPLADGGLPSLLTPKH